MRVSGFHYPDYFKLVQEDNYIPEVITVAGCNWHKAKKPNEKDLLGLTFLTQNDNLSREEFAFQVMLEVDDNEMESIEKCPLLVTNLEKNVQYDYCKIFEDINAKNGEYKRSHGIASFEFRKEKNRFVMSVLMNVDDEEEEVHIRDVYLTRSQYMTLNTFVFSFRSGIWLLPTIFLSDIYRNATPDIEIKTIMYIGTAVLGDKTFSIFEIYPLSPMYKSFTFVIFTGLQKKNRFLKKMISEADFMKSYANACLAQPANMISVSSPEFRVYLTLRNPSEETINVYSMDKETATRLNFFDWDKIIYM